jgi:acyl-CoA reductase-like NAD-dependent aldehyde dehydrogenase
MQQALMMSTGTHRMFDGEGGQSPQAAQAIASARAAQRSWAATPLDERVALVRRVRHALVARADTLAVTSGNGRTAETLVAQVLPLVDACRFLEGEAAQILAPRRPPSRQRPWWLAGVSLEIRREPLGVVLIIAPANYSLFLPGVQTLQALVAGNAVVLKPGAGGLPAARALAGVFETAGLNPCLFHSLSESPAAAGAAIATGVDKVLLTGSAATGISVLAELAPRLTPATLELSGCDAAFVRADADLDLVARSLGFGLRLNNGATCIAPRRVFVASERATDLETRLGRMARKLVPCPVAPAVAAAVADAVAGGARLIAGHCCPDVATGPLIVAEASPEMRLLQEDHSAPVLALVRVRDDEEALVAAGSCPYALGATVFGRESGARALAARVRAGAVVINDVVVPTADPRFPFGGRGRSGYGVTRGAEGLLDLTAVKALAIRRGRWRPHLDPPGPQDADLFRAYLTIAHGGSVKTRAQACLSLVRVLMRRRTAPSGGEMETAL